MYLQSPLPIHVNPTVSGGSLTFTLNYQHSIVPPSQLEFLLQCGWESAGAHPDTVETLYRKPIPRSASEQEREEWPYELGSGYWHWYEAVAYEFTRFITIGSDK